MASMHQVMPGGSPPRSRGRARRVSHGELGTVALELFVERGFEETTMDDIADAAGVSRRTLFRYFPSKNDLPWGDFDGMLDRLRSHLARVPVDVPVREALRAAVIEFNSFPPETAHIHRERMRLLLHVPALRAHSALRYAAWQQVVADFVATRTPYDARALVPQAVAGACLGVCIAAYESWLDGGSASLGAVLGEAFDAFDDVLVEAAP
ncbi:mycofactocin system transcriptional regulator [Microbacterium sp. G2-8]|uniref:mycofactocin system transcriptional regulator n=1 Tax=Microbacterium sp. G2-8 TaxID=2842454 RepID=UPI001C89BF16|nr:mycofactocin system transcriptional regulator [Microbacterium sp. G2-8]